MQQCAYQHSCPFHSGDLMRTRLAAAPILCLALLLAGCATQQTTNANGNTATAASTELAACCKTTLAVCAEIDGCCSESLATGDFKGCCAVGLNPATPDAERTGCCAQTWDKLAELSACCRDTLLTRKESGCCTGLLAAVKAQHDAR
jgi:hypothetical protein